MKRDDSVETLRQLLADASATAAKAHRDEEEDRSDDEDDEFLDEEADIDGTTTDTLAEDETDEGDRKQTRRLVFRQGVKSGSSSNCFDTGICSSSDAGLSMSDSEPLQQPSSLDINKEIQRLRARDLTMSRSIREAINQASSMSSPAAKNDECDGEVGTFSGSLAPRTALSAMRILASDWYNSQSQVKRLRARVRRLGQRVSLSR